MQTLRALEQVGGAFEHLDIILDLANKSLAESESIKGGLAMQMRASKIRSLASNAVEAVDALDRELQLEAVREEVQKDIYF